MKFFFNTEVKIASSNVGTTRLQTLYSEEEDVDYRDHVKDKDGLTVPDQVGDELDRLQAVRLLRVGEALLLQSLGMLA